MSSLDATLAPLAESFTALQLLARSHAPDSDGPALPSGSSASHVSTGAAALREAIALSSAASDALRTTAASRAAASSALSTAERVQGTLTLLAEVHEALLDADGSLGGSGDVLVGASRLQDAAAALGTLELRGGDDGGAQSTLIASLRTSLATRTGALRATLSTALARCVCLDDAGVELSVRLTGGGDRRPAPPLDALIEAAHVAGCLPDVVAGWALTARNKIFC